MNLAPALVIRSTFVHASFSIHDIRYLHIHTLPIKWFQFLLGTVHLCTKMIVPRHSSDAFKTSRLLLTYR